jgi:hypothetical protein
MYTIHSYWQLLAIYLPAIVLFVIGILFIRKAESLIKANLQSLKNIQFEEDFEEAISKQHRIAPQSVADDLDEKLGLVTIKTKLAAELYNKTIANLMHTTGCVEPAMIRYIIQFFEDAKWNQLEDMENPDLPRAGESVWGYVSLTREYLIVSMDEDHNWFIVLHSGMRLTPPPELQITHWKYPDKFYIKHM